MGSLQGDAGEAGARAISVKPIQVCLKRKTTAKHAPRDTHAQCSVWSPLAHNRAESRSAEHGAGGRERVGDRARPAPSYWFPHIGNCGPGTHTERAARSPMAGHAAKLTWSLSVYLLLGLWTTQRKRMPEESQLMCVESTNWNSNI